ncbi:L domain-like protein [Dioscorea alata]|uniref:L domain-like protein n=1 Tax=Dioscorea alata TaxID=55571 RepID=A0ACB7VQ63_DIOAL|nr:L domain-like protein [Dioscorea alata]
MDYICPGFSALKYLRIKNSRVVFDQLAGCLNGVSSLSDLVLDGAKMQIFSAKFMATLHALVKLNISKCNELISLEGLRALSPLERLFIANCSKFISWGTEEEMTEDGLPLPNLQYMEIDSCEDLETLPAWLPRLLSLNKLIIIKCPKIHLLPHDNLPSSLEKLHLIECEPSLTERCQQEGSLEWQMIQHIPDRQYTYY